MNKELIKKYKSEFDHWLNGGKLQSKFVNDPWEEAPEDIFSYNTINFILVIDDKYVEFRKALVEGKKIEVLDVDGKWKDTGMTSSSRAFIYPIEEYRIKQEEPKFKVGDWVRTEEYGVIQLNTINVDSYNTCPETHKKGSGLYAELWQPQPGEWCWVFNKLRGIPVLRRVVRVEDNFKNRYDDIKFTKAVRVGREDYLDEEVGYRFCEPFIGNLPSYINNKG